MPKKKAPKKRAKRPPGRPAESLRFEGTFDEAVDRVLKAGTPNERKPYKRAAKKQNP